MAIKTKKFDVKTWTLGGKIGHWLFLAGVVISIVLGVFYPDKTIIASILVLLGILVGFLNITSEEVHGFLLAAVALIISAKSVELVPLVGATIGHILQYIVILVAPAAVIVSLIAVWRMASTR